MSNRRIHPNYCRCVRCLPKHPTSARPLLAIAIISSIVAVLNAVVAALSVWTAL